ncbi:fluoride efflux transporter FluC [Sporolactobacillus laevolacticus]|uniref:Fluoride-specific ion channel FluC n=1 Tax=Sporolactobacillus laevolacticus DSM 442 TaxID=1395513 RepID=V6IYN3_9BACL|nr:CrcB family protein [Sporolactobacillus laevolacticus]EST12557.1 camphor resistance protein CrcB [Sporolactobacillus laevolacticus DSM 442]
MLINGIMVAIGAVFGVLGRATLSKQIDREKHVPFPIATFSINMIGCFILGFVVALPLEQHFLLLLTTGLIGTFTTFSTLNAENMKLLREKKFALFLCYAGGTYVFGILLIYAGLAAGHLFG